MDKKVLGTVLDKISRDEAVTLVTLTKSTGSTPRKSGSIMAVWKDGFIGSIGGGKVEYKVINIARGAIDNGDSLEFNFNLNNNGELGMTCGGEVEGYIKVFSPKPKVIIVGAGHIGQSVKNICKSMLINYLIIDDREELLRGEENAIIGTMDEELEKLKIGENTYIVLATRDHITDRDCLEKVIQSNAKYIGMLGSKKKVIDIKKHLIDKGIEESEFDKLYAPVGLKISNGSPEEIALEIIAEITKIKNNGELIHRRL